MNESIGEENLGNSPQPKWLALNFEELGAESVRHFADAVLREDPETNLSSPIASAFGDTVERFVNENPDAATPIVIALARSTCVETRELAAVVTADLIKTLARHDPDHDVPPELIELWADQLLASSGDESVAAMESLRILAEDEEPNCGYLGSLALQLAERGQAMAAVLRDRELDTPKPES